MAHYKVHVTDNKLTILERHRGAIVDLGDEHLRTHKELLAFADELRSQGYYPYSTYERLLAEPVGTWCDDNITDRNAAGE